MGIRRGRGVGSSVDFDSLRVCVKGSSFRGSIPIPFRPPHTVRQRDSHGHEGYSGSGEFMGFRAYQSSFEDLGFRGQGLGFLGEDLSIKA